MKTYTCCRAQCKHDFLHKPTQFSLSSRVLWYLAIRCVHSSWQLKAIGDKLDFKLAAASFVYSSPNVTSNWLCLWPPRGFCASWQLFLTHPSWQWNIQFSFFYTSISVNKLCVLSRSPQIFLCTIGTWWYLNTVL